MKWLGLKRRVAEEMTISGDTVSKETWKSVTNFMVEWLHQWWDQTDKCILPQRKTEMTHKFFTLRHLRKPRNLKQIKIKFRHTLSSSLLSAFHPILPPSFLEEILVVLQESFSYCLTLILEVHSAEFSHLETKYWRRQSGFCLPVFSLKCKIIRQY